MLIQNALQQRSQTGSLSGRTLIAQRIASRRAGGHRPQTAQFASLATLVGSGSVIALRLLTDFLADASNQHSGFVAEAEDFLALNRYHSVRCTGSQVHGGADGLSIESQ